MVNSNTVNSKFHLIRSYYEIFFYHFSNISCLKYTVNSNFHLIRSKTLQTNDFELTVPDLYSDEWAAKDERKISGTLKPHLHILSPSPSPSILNWWTEWIPEPISNLSIKQSVTIDTMIQFDDGRDCRIATGSISLICMSAHKASADRWHWATYRYLQFRHCHGPL